MKTLLLLTLSGSALALLLLALRYLILKRMPSTVYYYAWLLVLLRFALPLPGLVPNATAAEPARLEPVRAEERLPVNAAAPGYEQPAVEATARTEGSEPGAVEAPNPVPKLPQQELPSQADVQPAPAQASVRINWKDPALWLWVWAAGALVSLAVPLGAYLRFSRALRKTLRKPGKDILRQYASIPGKKPLLCVSRAAKTPLTLGLLQPRIILPADLGAGEDLANVLRHELTHFRRHDILYKWLALTVTSAHWFNPLTYVLRRELDRACELSCDEVLLRSMTREEKRSYGNTLLQMAASRALPVGVVATTFSTEKNDLKDRLKQIMSYKKSTARVLAAVLALLLMAGFGAVAGPAAEAARPASELEALSTEAPEAVPTDAPETMPEVTPEPTPEESPAPSPDEQYEAAAALAEAGDYEQAIAAFEALDGYRDSAEQIEACRTAILDEQYNAALALYANRNFAAAREAFAALGDYRDSYIRARAISAIQQPIGAGNKHTLAVRQDGSVVAVGINYNNQMAVGDWTDIISIAAGWEHTLGLRSDGSVVSCGANYFYTCDVSDWTDMVAVAAAYHQSVGLRADGTVVARGQYVDGELSEQGWTDIVCISASPCHTVGLRSDGTVLALGLNKNGECEVSDWTDIVAVAAGDGVTVGLRSDGTVVAAGSNTYGQCEVSDWTDIVAVAVGSMHTVGLRSDGTVVTAGSNAFLQCEVSDWTDIVAISAGDTHTVGLRADGSAVATGANATTAQASIQAYEVRPDGSIAGGGPATYSIYDGRCDVSEWTELRLPE